jgi:hypothetical protein
MSDILIFKITDDVGESQDLSARRPRKLTARLKENYKQLLDGSHIWK